MWFKYFVGFAGLVTVALVWVAGCAKPQKPPSSPVQPRASSSAAPPSSADRDASAMKAADKQSFATFSPAEQQTLRQLAGRGAVVVVENNADAVPAVHVMAVVNAPADRIAAWLANPAHYRRHMPAVDEVQVDGTHGRSAAYGWQWRLGGAGLRGRATVTVLSDGRIAPSARTYLVDHRHTSGDLGVGRAVWRISPMPSTSSSQPTPSETRSTVLLSMRTDLRAGNYWVAELATKSKSFSRSTSIAMAVFMMTGLRHAVHAGSNAVSTHEAGSAAPPAPDSEGGRVLVQALRVGDIAYVDAVAGLDGVDATRNARQQVWAAGRMGVGLRKVRAVFDSPLRFARAMMHSSMASATTEPVSPDEVLLRWGVSIPVLGSAGVMRVTRTPDGAMAVMATEGAMHGGTWHFTHSALPWGEGFVVGHGDFEPAEGSWITRQLGSNHPYWLPGLAVASQVLAVRAIRLYLNP